MHQSRKWVREELEYSRPEKQVTRMNHNAESAELENLGSYIKPGPDDTPSISLTATYLLKVFDKLKEGTDAARSRSDIPAKPENEQA